MRRYHNAGLLAVLLAALIPAAARADDGPVHPASSQVAQPVRSATFEGRQIALNQDWGDARVCAIFTSTAVCSRSDAKMDQTLRVSPAVEDAAAARCSSPLRLYRDDNSKGTELRFYDRGYWQNLTNYGFNDQTSSFTVGACAVHLAEHVNGGGYWYPCNTGPFAAVSVMRTYRCSAQTTSWNDRVSSIYIQ